MYEEGRSARPSLRSDEGGCVGAPVDMADGERPQHVASDWACELHPAKPDAETDEP